LPVFSFCSSSSVAQKNTTTLEITKKAFNILLNAWRSSTKKRSIKPKSAKKAFNKKWPE